MFSIIDPVVKFIVNEEFELDAMKTDDIENDITPESENALGMDDLLTKNVRKIEEERKLLRALVGNSNSVGGLEKARARKKSISDVSKQHLFPISNNINQTSTSSSPSRSCRFTKSCM